MSKHTHTHAMLLALQLASVFKYVADAGHHREIYKSFHPLEGDVITFTYNDQGNRKGRVSVDILVKTEHNTFVFKQWYNFGLLLELELLYYRADGSTDYLMANFLESDDSDSEMSGRMIDFEYAISILTEHVATQLNRFS